MLEKTEGTTKNGQFRVNQQHRAQDAEQKETKKQKNTTQKINQMSNTDPTKIQIISNHYMSFLKHA